MRQSQLFTKVRKDVSQDEHARSAQFLLRAGFVHKDMAGVFSFLPLGWRVLEKIIGVIRKEMNAIGGVEVHLSSLQDPNTWKASDRWDDAAMDVWFKTKLKNDTEVGLAATHEEPLAKVMSEHIASYRDVPRYVYQFQTKFRNELRAKSGLMRTREFIMKDLYSFTASTEELDAFYELVKVAYRKIFDTVGIGHATMLTFASGGAFSKYSHEFQTLCDAGEDTIYVAKERGIAVNHEVLNDEVLDELGLRRDELEEHKAIEVGNIFKLGTRFSEAEGLMFVDRDDARKPVVMGSYGIGPARVMATVAELLSDEHGLVWPDAIAPFRVHLLGLGLDRDANVKTAAEECYAALSKQGIDVLYDDRDMSAGQKFAESDILGIPHRLVISPKTMAAERIEYKHRTSASVESLTLAEVLTRLG